MVSHGFNFVLDFFHPQQATVRPFAASEQTCDEGEGSGSVGSKTEGLKRQLLNDFSG